MESKLEIAAIQSDEVSDVAQPSTSSDIGKHKKRFRKDEAGKGRKKKEKLKKKSKKSRKKF